MNEQDYNEAAERLMQKAAELPRDIHPERDLWADIEAGIDAPAPSMLPWRRYLAQAAAVLLLVGGSSGLTYLALGGDARRVSPVVQAGEQALPLNANVANFGEQYTLGPDFQDARRDLEGRLERELDRLSPSARSDVEANMQTIRTAINEISAALSEEPDNVLLQELLLSTYQEELSLMRKVNGITSTVMLREDF